MSAHEGDENLDLSEVDALTTAPTQELLPCPFCGGEAIFRQGEMERLFWVECSRCEIGTKYYQYRNEYDANLAWNRRALLADRFTPEEIETVRRIAFNFVPINNPDREALERIAEKMEGKP